MNMGTEIDKGGRLISWNGIQLRIPATWDERVTGKHHLVFEKDFQPQLQIRWEKSGYLRPETLVKKRGQFIGWEGSVIPEDLLPRSLRQLKVQFSGLSCYQGESGRIEGGMFFCRESGTLILFQLLAMGPEFLVEAADCLATISYPLGPDTLWQVQDWSLTVPALFQLQDYGFGAGLSRLSFSAAACTLQTCILGPADIRLSQQPLDQILLRLTGSSNLKLTCGKHGSFCQGYRDPSIQSQILLRLRREKPFIRNKIWHDAAANRLLAVILSSKRPISMEMIDMICSGYEIIRKNQKN